MSKSDDLIRRSDAIEAVDRVDEAHMRLKGRPMLGWCALLDEIESIPSAEPKTGEWIPVSERLPEEYGEYLVTKRTIGWNCEEYGSNDIAYFDSDGFHKADKVTAWMPLPEPYKGDGEA